MSVSWVLSVLNSRSVKSLGCWDDILGTEEHSLQGMKLGFKNKLIGTSSEAADMAEHLDRKLLPVECIAWGRSESETHCLG